MRSLRLTLCTGLLFSSLSARADIDKPPTTPDMGLPPPGGSGPGSPAPIPEKKPKRADTKDQKSVDK